eukprot:3231977-Pyramimonas_sp.AAC.1
MTAPMGRPTYTSCQYSGSYFLSAPLKCSSLVSVVAPQPKLTLAGAGRAFQTPQGSVFSRTAEPAGCHTKLICLFLKRTQTYALCYKMENSIGERMSS